MKVSHEKQDEFTCKLCAYQFTDTEKLREHMNASHKKQDEFTEAAKLSEHMNAVHIQEFTQEMENKHANLICEICAYICSSNNYLNQHKDSHMDFMIISRLCKTLFNHYNELQKH